jgi:hypothetical protein
MPDQTPFKNWQEILDAPRSEFFSGHTSDSVFDRQFYQYLTPSTEANFTQSNARVLLGQAANGSLRFLALPTQVYPAPTQMNEFGLGPGMYHHFDVAMYAGNLTYQIALENGEIIDLSAPERENETWYADHFIPLTRTREGDLEMTVLAFAPVAPDGSTAALAPAPLPGPAGAFYLLRLRNSGNSTKLGKVFLKAGDSLVGHYEDFLPELQPLKQPDVTIRQNTLILSRPEGSVGIHLHGANWVQLTATFSAEKSFELAPGEEQVFETYLGMGADYAGVMPEIYNLYLRPPLDWLNRTAAFWRSRLGQLEVGPDALARFSQEIYVRSLFDNFNCLQTDAQGNLIAHWQGAPSHGYGTVWGIDVEPTAVSVAHICPELARQTMIFFMTRSRAPRGPIDHSVPILVAPVIIARQWLQITGDSAFLISRPDILTELEKIMADLLSLKAPDEPLFPSLYSSDGAVGRRYDYGTNVKVWYAFDSMAYLLEQIGRVADGAQYRQVAQEMPDSIRRTMVAEGPFGPQISGGTNLGNDPGDFYLPEDAFYYDGEDTSSMLAPIYGITGFDDQAWGNYHRFARSLWCPNFDPEFDTLYWFPSEPAVFDGTAYVSRLGGCLTRAEMAEGLQNIFDRYVDRPTGSLFWWPHSDEFRRGITRCSQGQGAWAWQYLYQWLGLIVDAPSRTLTLAPRGLLTRIQWQDFAAGPFRFVVDWREGPDNSSLTIKNRNSEPWTIKIGTRRAGEGAEGRLHWQQRVLSAGEECSLQIPLEPARPAPGLTRRSMIEKETAALGGEDGLLFKRFGPVMLWGHWDGEKLWDFIHLPLTLRFLVQAAGMEELEQVRVRLNPQDGWRVQGRRPFHWDRPTEMRNDESMVELGTLSVPARQVASFWVQPPDGIVLDVNFGNQHQPAHTPSQPGPGVKLYAHSLRETVETTFIARLEAVTSSGKKIERELIIPVKIKPA